MAEAYSVMALSPIRKVIAARMTEASAIPHFRLAIDVELDALIGLPCDHRAIDGATGAAFLSALRQRIERPEHMAP